MHTHTKSKQSAVIQTAQNNLFWLFELYQQTSKTNAHAVTPFFNFADYCFAFISELKQKELAEHLLISFIHKSAPLLNSAFQIEKNNKTEFVFFLTEDNTTHRLQIFDFLEFYEHLEIAQTIPIVFRILPPQAEEEFIKTKKFTQLL